MRLPSFMFLSCEVTEGYFLIRRRAAMKKNGKVVEFVLGLIIGLAIVGCGGGGEWGF